MRTQRLALSAMLAAATFSMFVSAASAAIVQVASPAGLTQGLYTVATFESDIATPGVTFSAASGVQRVGADAYAGSTTPSGLYGLATYDYPDPITLTFAAPVSSVGMYFGNDDTCCTTGFTAFLDIYGSGGLLGTISVVANLNDRADQFLGFISDQQITRTVIRYGSGADVGLYHYIDDVQFNGARSEVPEPWTVALLALGLAGVAVTRSRKVCSRTRRRAPSLDQA
jgi:hypothetical protein